MSHTLNAEYLQRRKNNFIDKAINRHGSKYGYDLVDYINGTTKVEIFCNKCHVYFSQSPDIHARGHGCPTCGNKKNAKRFTKPYDLFLEEAQELHGDNFIYHRSSYLSRNEKMWMTCKTCGLAFKKSPSDHLRPQGCPSCNKCKRETETGDILLSMFDRVVRQVPLRIGGHKHPLRFDFQVQDNKTFVEHHGIQHYEPVSHFGGEEEFERRKQYDKLKADWCKQHGWNLIIVPYWIDDIRSFLEQEFSEIPTT